ncbi:MAG: DUF5050 domain-containing protein [Oscillospiraceae bacterium]|jgi:hypothetical protein|nr:DUF5050 domain-containing protein [Oscillospiraceae bacterium]
MINPHKKTIVIAIIILLLLGFGAWGVSAAINASNKPKPTASPEVSPPPDTPTPTVTVTLPEEITHTLGNTNGNINNGGYVIKTGKYLFFSPGTTIGDTVYRLDVETNSVTVFDNTKDSPGQPATDINGITGNFNVYNDRIYFSAMNPNRHLDGLYSSDLEGAGHREEQNNRSFEFLGKFIIADGRLYYWWGFENAPDYISRFSLSTKYNARITETQDYYFSVNITADKVYYTAMKNIDPDKHYEAKVENLRAGQIYSMKLDGSEAEQLSEQLAINLIADGDWLYYINFDTLRLEKMNIDTLQVEVIGTEACSGFNIADGKIFCAADTGINILDFDGKVLKKYKIGGYHWDTNINVIDQWIFFRQPYEGTIYRIDTVTDKIDMLYEDSTKRDKKIKAGDPYVEITGNEAVYTDRPTITEITTNYGDVFELEYHEERGVTFLQLKSADYQTPAGFKLSANEITIVGVLDNNYVRIYKVGNNIMFRRETDAYFWRLGSDFKYLTDAGAAIDLVPYIKPLFAAYPELEEMYGAFVEAN